jgi:hypothetical protein
VRRGGHDSGFSAKVLEMRHGQTLGGLGPAHLSAFDLAAHGDHQFGARMLPASAVLSSSASQTLPNVCRAIA